MTGTGAAGAAGGTAGHGPIGRHLVARLDWAVGKR